MPQKGGASARMSRRIGVEVQSRFSADGVHLEGEFVEVSDGGGLFCTSERLESGTKGEFTIKFFENEPEVALPGEIIYQRQEETDKKGTTSYGVRFGVLDEEVKEILGRFLRTATVRRRYVLARTVVPYEKKGS